MSTMEGKDGFNVRLHGSVTVRCFGICPSVWERGYSSYRGIMDLNYIAVYSGGSVRLKSKAHGVYSIQHLLL